MTIEELEKEDKLALAEAYRVYELLSDSEKQKVPQDFVDTLLYFGDLRLVKPLDPSKKLADMNLSERGLYITMYMCTLAKE